MKAAEFGEMAKVFADLYKKFSEDFENIFHETVRCSVT
jgi:hypothetical protein